MQASQAQNSREETISSLTLAFVILEMADEMFTLNSDRNETAFATDPPLNNTQAISLVQGVNATANGEKGLVSSNTYGAAYYPSVSTDPLVAKTLLHPTTVYFTVMRTMTA